MQGVPEHQDPNVFTVIVRDRTYKLSGQQILRDAPNYFTSHFFSPLGQRMVAVLHICRDPQLFELILRYINGYKLFPFHPNMFPAKYPPEVAMADLRADAQFYQLDGLVRLCVPQNCIREARTLWYLLTCPPPPDGAQSSACYAVITGYFRVLPGDRPSYPAESFQDFIPRFSMILLSDAHFEAASNKMSTVTKASLDKVSPHNVTVASWSERIVRAVLRRDTGGVERWELLGWKKDVANEIRNSATFVKLWVGPGFSVNA